MKRTELRRKTPLRTKATSAKTGLSRSLAAPSGRSKTKAGKPSPRRSSTAKRPLEPGETEWKRSHRGRCAICGRRGRVVWHHAVAEQEIRRATTAEQQAAGIVYDSRWAIPLCAPYIMSGQTRPCHDGHHHWSIKDTRLPFSKVAARTRQLAVETLGEGPTIEYLRRHYRDVS